MAQFVSFGRVKSEFADLDRYMIKHELTEIGDKRDIDVDLNELSGSSQYSIFNIGYEWEIDSNTEKGVFLVTEDVSISRVWLLVFLFSIYSLAFAYAGFWLAGINMVLAWQLGKVFFGFSVVGFTISVLPLAQYPGVLVNMRGVSEGYIRYTVFDIPIVILSTSVVLSVFASMTGLSYINLGLLPITVYVGAVIRRDPQRFVRLSEQFRENNPLTQLPPIAGEYIVVSLVLSGLSLSVMLTARHLLNLYEIGWIPAIILIPTLAIVSWIFTQVTGEGALDAFFDIKQGHKLAVGRSYRIIYSVVIVAISYVSIGILNAALIALRSLISHPSSPRLFSGLLLFSVVPLLYFPVGLVFQTWLYLSEKARILYQAEQAEIDIDTECVILEITGDRYGPASLSTGFRNYILLPHSVLQELNDEEIRAVVAHEERHIQNKDALIAFYVPILGLFLMTGQNVFYSLLNFRDREFKADRYAVRTTGSRVVVKQALEKLGNNNTDRKPMNCVERYFGLFYGNFALSKAHPTVSERKAQISKYELDG